MSDTRYPWLAQADFEDAAGQLFPTGPAWPRDLDTVQQRFRAGIADVQASFHFDVAQVTEVEFDPRQTLALLPDWETDYGLPDPCTPLGATVQQRRNALVAKIRARGGSTPTYFEAVAAALGFTIAVRDGIPADGAGWQDTWVVTAQAAAQETFFTAGESQAGDYLNTFNNAELECRLNHLKPAHTVLIVNYV